MKVAAKQRLKSIPNGTPILDCNGQVKQGTSKGWFYDAAVIDLFSLQVVGWAINDHMRTSLL